MNVRSAAAMMPGIVSGSVTCRNAARPAGVQVAGGRDERRVEPVDRDVERQDRERQEAVGHAQDDREVGVEQDDRLAR